VTRYFDVDDGGGGLGRRDVMFVDWSDVVIERARRTGVVTRATLLDRAADNFTAVIRYAPDDSPLVAAQTVTLSAAAGTYNSLYVLHKYWPVFVVETDKQTNILGAFVWSR